MFDSSGSYCCGCYIVDHYCFMFDRGVVHIVVVGYIVDHRCFIFDRGVVHVVVVVSEIVIYHKCVLNIKSRQRGGSCCCGC